jgi:NDP-sugar pyrophosphorylase family protein
MAPYTSTMPKILIPVNGRPFIQHQLDLLQSQGFSRVVLSLGYLSDMVVEELRTHPHDQLEILCQLDGDVPLGTGGAVRMACEELIKEDHFFVTFGDSYLIIDPEGLMRAYDPVRFDAIMSLYPNSDNLDVSNARLLDDGAAVYMKNQPDPCAVGLDMVDFGLSYIARESVLRGIPLGQPSDMASFMERLSLQHRLQGWVTEQRFYEIGSHAGRDALEHYLSGEN